MERFVIEGDEADGFTLWDSEDRAVWVAWHREHERLVWVAGALNELHKREVLPLRAAVAAERERAAGVCERYADDAAAEAAGEDHDGMRAAIEGAVDAARACAAAIRAGGA
jgi:hypothetical protein